MSKKHSTCLPSSAGSEGRVRPLGLEGPPRFSLGLSGGNSTRTRRDSLYQTVIPRVYLSPSLSSRSIFRMLVAIHTSRFTVVSQSHITVATTPCILVRSAEVAGALCCVKITTSSSVFVGQALPRCPRVEPTRSACNYTNTLHRILGTEDPQTNGASTSRKTSNKNKTNEQATKKHRNQTEAKHTNKQMHTQRGMHKTHLQVRRTRTPPR